jgi:hypothetical protein
MGLTMTTLKQNRITNTAIGQEYCVDWPSEISLDLLRKNLAAIERVLANPALFPRADMVGMNRRAIDHRALLRLYGEP